MGCCHPTHKIPNFPLTCRLWRAGTGPPSPPISSPKCQLSVHSYTGPPSPAASGPLATLVQSLWLPKGVDIRPIICVGGPDVVEVPAGSGRVYTVYGVDDVAKGFANEFRVAYIYPTTAFGTWPVPIP